MADQLTAPIFPITALSKQTKEVKEAAEQGPVRITENGRGAYVFMSENALKQLIERERADAAYEAYLLDAVSQGVTDIESGNYTISREAMFARANSLRSQYA